MRSDDKFYTGLPQVAAEYIRLVAKKVGYKRKVRNEIRDELIGHFEDALAPFTDPAQREQKAKELIAEFGDAKILATLARRAKKRCRPMWVQATIRCFQILLLTCAAYAIWFITGTPKIEVNYVAKLNETVKPQADDSLNAAPIYHSVELLIPKPDSLEKAGMHYSQLDPNLKAVARKWVSDNQKAMDHMRQGFTKPYLWETYSEPNNSVINISLPDLNKYRYFAYLLNYEAGMYAEQGEFDKAADNLIGMFKLGRQLKGDKILIDQLVGISLQALSMGSVRDIAGNYELPEPVLVKLKNGFDKIAATDPYRASYKAERMCMEDTIQRCFTDGPLGSHLYLKALVKWLSINNDRDGNWKSLIILSYMFYNPGKKTTMAQLEKMQWYMDDIFAISPGQIHAQKIDYDKKMRSITKGNYFLQYLKPAVQAMNERAYRNKMEYQATDTILALLIYKQQKGQYPAGLETLVTDGLIKALPQDAFSTAPLIYKRTDSGFNLYSVGLNFTDEGGKIDRNKKGEINMWNKDKGDAVFWPVSN